MMRRTLRGTILPTMVLALIAVVLGANSVMVQAASPTIGITPAIGTPGTVVIANGSGFSANETGITVTYDGRLVASGISASSLGNWTGTFTVPASSSGTHVVSAYGVISQVSSLGGLNFQVTPGVAISPASGYVGEALQISGSGFAANSALSFTYDNNAIPAGGATTEANGSFTKSLVAPKSRGGSHTINVTDARGSSAKAIFTMDSTPPPVSSPVSPEDGARIGILGGVTPTFNWSSVTDPSGVTYTLQVASNADFTQPIVEKTNLTANHYTLTAAEALPLGQYYWRVKSIDSADNEGAWSPVLVLKSGLLSL